MAKWLWGVFEKNYCKKLPDYKAEIGSFYFFTTIRKIFYIFVIKLLFGILLKHRWKIKTQNGLMSLLFRAFFI